MSAPAEAATALPGTPEDEQAVSIFSLFFQLEEAARNAPSLAALRFSLANELRRLIDYRQAVVVAGSAGGPGVQVAAVSGVAVLERDAPMIRWLERAAAQLAAAPAAGTVHPVAPAELALRERREAAEWWPAHGLWCPLTTGDGRTVGALWLGRDHPWQAAEITMVTRLAGCYAHAWLALSGGRSATRRRRGRTLVLAAVAALGLAALAWPVPQSALAPVSIVAARPVVVAAPIDGVIARFHVSPNQPVVAGQPLLDFDDTTLKHQAAVAERTLGVARAELRQAAQGAMVDRKHGEQVALLEAQAELRAAELDYARSLLARVNLSAERSGIAVFTDANDWLGRSVVTGQRILQIADPQRIEARIDLPVHDSIVLTAGAEVALFLDHDPLRPLPARLVSASYEAEPSASGVLSYRLMAAISGDQALPRIGLQGVARVSGVPVPLGFYLFRRPLTALRQWVGY